MCRFSGRGAFMPFVCALWLVCGTGCDSPTTGDAAVKSPVPEPLKGMARLSPEEIASAGVTIGSVGRGEFRSYREFPGTVAPNQHALAEVTTLVRGRVVDVYADLGQQVKTGDLLALLYSGELGMAQSAYLKADARLYVAERSFERAKMLLAEKVIGLAEAQRRKGDMLSIQAEKREARDRLELYGMSDEHIRKLDQDHTIRSYVPIMAPFDGRVIARNLTKGEVVETTEKLFTVADLSEVWVLGNIPEKDIPFIQQDETGPSQKIDILINAYPNRVFHGKLTYVGDVLEARTRTMNLRIEVPNADRKLKPEMYATIRVYSEPEKNVLAVPEQAIQRERDRKFVFVQREEGIFEVRDVTLGESNGQVVKVLEGLREGEKIVTAGAFILKSELLGEQM
jgi:cobalt-zinc-cadmium efflux system membrane fusion protein